MLFDVEYVSRRRYRVELTVIDAKARSLSKRLVGFILYEGNSRRKALEVFHQAKGRGSEQEENGGGL